ncbi:LuxR family transcriptional regulator [Streptomyces pactum]|uniref:LuxR family transcriptional regulator n=1 Tax=Streptomyces pactum TaxID=68249 RepID=UPI0036FEE441
MPDPREDELERMLLEVKARLESVVALRRDRGGEAPVITAVNHGYGAVLATARTLIGRAAHSIDIVHARRPSAEERALRPSERAERELLREAAGVVRVRLLTTPGLLDDEFVREQGSAGRPADVRVTRMAPLQALVVDGRAALVVADSAAGRRSSVIRVPEVLHSLDTLFQSVWRDALPAGEDRLFGDRRRAAIARRILHTLQAGVTDEVAARELTVCVRTYRSHVAEIMAKLGATSRFQAGVRAAELGLLRPVRASGAAAGRT